MPELTQFAMFVLFAVLAGVVGFYLVVVLKRWMNSDPTAENLTLQDLREMRARNDITDAEFERMRALIIGKYAQTDDSAASADSTPDNG